MDLLPDKIREKLNLEGLTPRQKKFILHFAGSGDVNKSVLDAGYRVRHPHQAYNQAYKLSKIPQVQKNLEILEMELQSELIASAAECKQHLTEIARDTANDLPHRLTALKLLLQTHGSLSEKLIVEQHTTHDIQINLPLPANAYMLAQANGTSDVIDVQAEPQDLIADIL